VVRSASTTRPVLDWIPRLSGSTWALRARHDNTTRCLDERAGAVQPSISIQTSAVEEATWAGLQPREWWQLPGRP